MNGAGARLFARYAYVPNKLGYCGPAEAAALFELGATGRTDADVHAIARQFTGAWPYAAVLARLSGIGDPLDERVMRAYWTGGPLLDTVDPATFGQALLDRIGAAAGRYWEHLTADLLPEAAPTHGFHVFGVYPWSRLLADAPTVALGVLDECRIRWGRVLDRDGEHVIVRCRRLAWDGRALALGAAHRERVRIALDGRSFVPDARAGDWLALHWDWVCERLGAADLAQLRRRTRWQLDATNLRLAAAAAPSRRSSQPPEKTASASRASSALIRSSAKPL